MENKNEKTNPVEKTNSGVATDAGNRASESEAGKNQAAEHKDESQSYMDYNGNSEANAPARSQDGGE